MTEQSGDRELWALSLLGGLAAAGIVAVEAASAVGGLFASGHPVILSLPDAGRTLGALVAGRGSRAWPSGVRARLPGSLTAPLVFGALLSALAYAAAVWAALRWLRPVRTGEARWAERGDLRKLEVRRPQPGRVTIGRYQGRLVAAERESSTLLMGPTRLAAKTSGVVIPNVREWAGPEIVTGTKLDVLEQTIAHRERAGKVKVFDAGGRTGITPAAWSPLAASRTWTGAREVAATLMQVGWESTRFEREPHWRPAGARFLAPALLAAAGAGLAFEEVLSWIETRDKDTAAELLERSRAPHAARALSSWRSVWHKDPRYLSNLLATVEEALDAWQEPSVLQATAGEDISAEWLLQEGKANTLYVIGPEKDQRRLPNLYAALLMTVLDDALAIAATRPSGTLDPPLLAVLEEVANIAPIPNLARYAATGIGPGVLLLTVLQDYAQALEHWGSERGQSILAAHTCKLFCSGIADPPTLRYISDLLGHKPVKHTSKHRGDGRSSTTVSEQMQPLAPPHAIRQHPEHTALCVYGRIPPAWIDLRPYWRDAQAPPRPVGDGLGNSLRRRGSRNVRSVAGRRASRG